MGIVVLVALAVLIIGGLVWFFIPKKPVEPSDKPTSGDTPSSGDTPPLPEPGGDDSPTDDNSPCESETHRIDGCVDFLSTTERVEVGWYDFTDMLDCVWSIKDNEGVNFLSDIKFEDGKITAVISESNYGEERTTRYITHLEGKGVSKDDYFDVTQCSGADIRCHIPPMDKQFEDDYLNIFTSVGISARKTPCTYTYLKDVYDYVKDNNSQIAISWAIANALSEITPYDGLPTSYFVDAANRYGGNKLSFNDNEDVYNERIKGGFEYAKYKHDKYAESNEMADNARKELHEIGIGTGELIEVSEFDYKDPIYVNLDCLIPFGPPANEKDNADYRVSQKEIKDNPNGTKQAISDKNSSDEYVCENIFGLPYNDAYSNFLEYGGGFTSAANGFVKWNDDFARWRPGAYQKIEREEDKFVVPSKGTVYVATERTSPSYRSKEVDDISYTSACGACGGCNGECDRCNDDDCVGGYPCNDDCTRAKELGIGDRCPEDGMNSYQSFPSGHSCKAYFQYLMCLEASGNEDKFGRVLDYCYNRVVVRAHWYSDVIAGKFNASCQIGFMNGIKNFHDKLPK